MKVVASASQLALTIVTLVASLLAATPAPVHPQSAPDRALQWEVIILILLEPESSSARLLEDARERCVAEPLTPAIAAQIRQARPAEDGLVEAFQEVCVRRPSAAATGSGSIPTDGEVPTELAGRPRGRGGPPPPSEAGASTAPIPGKAAAGATGPSGPDLAGELGTDTDPASQPAKSAAGGIASAIDEAISRMRWGAIAFNPPAAIERGQTHEIHLVLEPRGDEAEAISMLPSGGASASARVRFSDRMVARLESAGEGLVIIPVTPAEQAVSSLEPTTWIWTVRGAAAGSHRLLLTLDAILDVDGELVPRSLRTFSESIEVTVSPWSFFAGPGGWLVVALAVVLGGLGAAWALNRRRAAGPVPPPRHAPPPPGPTDAGIAHDVFISHSTRDGEVAVRICEALEADGIRCWMAPRDITPGAPWDEAIIDAIDGCGIMVLVLSTESNSSRQVVKEVRNAVEAGKTVIPFRTEDVTLAKALRYHISAAHWVDAARGNRQEHVRDLVATVRRLRKNDPAPVVRS